jgi:oligopeptide transport system ATP-binding protein
MEAPLFAVSETHYASTWLLDPRAPPVKAPAVLEKRRAEYFGRLENYGGV